MTEPARSEAGTPPARRRFGPGRRWGPGAIAVLLVMAVAFAAYRYGAGSAETAAPLPAASPSASATALSTAEVYETLKPSVVTIEATGTTDKLAALLKVLEPYGIRELVQSGMVAVGRGPRSFTGTALRALDRPA